MTPGTDALLADPLFQLNFVLWMLQPLPQSADVRPIFKEAGYVLDSISRDLPLPPSLLPAIRKLLGSADAPAPDVLAHHAESGSGWLVVECKGKGFGPSSSNARQATKLLAVAPDLTDALALPRKPNEAHVEYLTTLDQREGLVDTLLQLRSDLQAAEVAGGEVSALGVSREPDGVYVERSPRGGWPAALQAAISGPTRVIAVEPDDDPRPLYLIPWDPGIPQDPEMREFCRAVLYSRLAAEATAVLGRAQVPNRVVLQMDRLVSEATFGVSDRWRSKGDLAKVLVECKRFVAAALGPVKERLSVALPSGPERVEFTLNSGSDQEAAIDALTKADPFGAPPAEPENQPTLFEGQES